MAHQIEKNYAFYASNTPAWHKLGTVLKDAPTIEEAWKLAYPHSLIECEVSAHIGEASESVPDYKAIFRDDGKFIAMVKKTYELVQPYSTMNFFEPYIDSGLVELEAGGSLFDGKQMFALAKIKNTESDVLPGDSVKGYFLAVTSFDGSLAHTIKFTGTRVVCANTLAIALGETGQFKRLRHTKNIHARIADIQHTVNIAQHDFSQSVDQYRALARKRVRPQLFEPYVRAVFDAIPTKDKPVSDKMEAKVRHVLELVDNQIGMQYVPAMRGTAWQAYNAVSQYLTHDYGRSDDTKLAGQWYGPNVDLNEKALSLAMTM